MLRNKLWDHIGLDLNLGEEQSSKASRWKASCPSPSGMLKFQSFMHRGGIENTLRLEKEWFCEMEEGKVVLPK